MREYEENPYAPPLLSDNDGFEGAYDEDVEPEFDYRFEKPQRFTVPVYLMLNFTFAISLYAGAFFHLAMVTNFVWICTEPFNMTSRIACYFGCMFFALLVFLWWKYGFALSRLSEVYRWIAEPVRARIPKDVDPVLVQVIYNVQFDKSFLAIPRIKTRIRHDVGYVFLENDVLRFEGDYSGFTINRNAVENRGALSLFKRLDINLSKEIFYLWLIPHTLQPYECLVFSAKGNGTLQNDIKYNKTLESKITAWINADDI